MARAFKIVFLIVFAFNWVPQGGAVVRYPTLERMLERIDKEIPTEIAKEIRCHSIPSAMCGVKAVIESNQNVLLGLGQLPSISFAPVAAFDIFVLMPKYDLANLRLKNQPISLSIPKTVFLPPPRISV